MSGIQRTIATPWTFRDQRVLLSVYADIATNLRPANNSAKAPAGKDAQLVQRVLDTWPDNAGTVCTVELEGVRLLPMVTKIRPEQRDRVVWGIHAGHKARYPQPSPFLRLKGAAEHRGLLTNRVTVHLDPRSHAPIVVRAYPGDFAPPLPWMGSVRDEPGGFDACAAFWHEYAFVTTPQINIMRQIDNAQSYTPPWW